MQNARPIFHQRCLALLLALALAPTALAQNTNALTIHSNLPDVGLSAIRAVGALALVLGLFFGGVWLFRKSQRFTWRKNGEPRLAILESRALGNRLALYVVAYEQQRMLIGSSPTGLSLLSHLPPSPEPNPLPASTNGASFTQCLQQVLSQK